MGVETQDFWQMPGADDPIEDPGLTIQRLTK
jgi:hypothetical protein